MIPDCTLYICKQDKAFQLQVDHTISFTSRLVHLKRRTLV